MRHQLSRFSFEIPEDWCDITPEDEGDYPFTMAREGGLGVIQVSLAEWKSGPIPQVDAQQLGAMFARYCETQRLAIDAKSFDNGSVGVVGGTYSDDAELTAAWYVNGGGNFALVTYVNQCPQDPASETELAVAKQLVASARFEA